MKCKVGLPLPAFMTWNLLNRFLMIHFPLDNACANDAASRNLYVDHACMVLNQREDAPECPSRLTLHIHPGNNGGEMAQVPTSLLGRLGNGSILWLGSHFGLYRRARVQGKRNAFVIQ
jgi:hypothetical protein